MTDLPWRRHQQEPLPSLAPLECILIVNQKGSFRLASPAPNFTDLFPDFGSILWTYDFFCAEAFPMLSPGIVNDGLAVTTGLAHGLFVIFGHVPLESQRSTSLGRGGHSTFLILPLGGVLVYSRGSRSSLGDSGIGCFENYVPNVLKVSVDTCVRRVNCRALLI